MSDLLGRTLGQYQLIEAIDESGSVMVYKGFQPATNRFVTIKALKPGVAHDPVSLGSFQQAGALAAQIQHLRILQVYESGQDQGLYFRAEQLAQNGSLRDHLGGGSANRFFDANRVLFLFKEIVEGLNAIYARGYIHGNLKPSNILLDAEYRPLLADIGQSALSGSSPNPHRSPEQVQGAVVDRRSDVYALGVLLYEVFVGETPPAGVVVSLRARRPDLPESIDPVVFKAMAQNPDYRFQTADEFFNALQSALASPAPVAQPVYSAAQPAQAPQITQTVTVGERKSSSTNWLMIIMGVFLVAIVCIGAFLVIPALLRDNQATPGIPTQPPSITQVLPTQPPPEQPTQPPEQPTQPPEQPTQPPEQPTQPPEQPTQPPDQPSEPAGPEATDQPPGGGLPSVCSSFGLAGGVVVLGGAIRSKRRVRNR